jgi:hypothetical protein
MTIENYSLQTFQTYDATKPETEINSTSKDSARKWARKASFMQLGYALELYRMDNELTYDQRRVIDEYCNHVFGENFKNKPLTERSDIEKALDTLETLGIDVSTQRAQLDSWN